MIALLQAYLSFRTFNIYIISNSAKALRERFLQILTHKQLNERFSCLKKDLHPSYFTKSSLNFTILLSFDKTHKTVWRVTPKKRHFSINILQYSTDLPHKGKRQKLQCIHVRSLCIGFRIKNWYSYDIGLRCFMGKT